jgi:hypothetical protein
MLQLGAKKIGEEIIAYFGEPDRLNYVYEMRKLQELTIKIYSAHTMVIMHN